MTFLEGVYMRNIMIGYLQPHQGFLLVWICCIAEIFDKLAIQEPSRCSIMIVVVENCSSHADLFCAMSGKNTVFLPSCICGPLRIFLWVCLIDGHHPCVYFWKVQLWLKSLFFCNRWQNAWSLSNFSPLMILCSSPVTTPKQNIITVALNDRTPSR